MGIPPKLKTHSCTPTNSQKWSARGFNPSQWLKKMGSGLRFPEARTTASKIIYACLLLAGILFPPARSQAVLEFLTPQQLPEGGRVEIRTPDGLDCTSQQSDRPSVNAGAGFRPDPLIGLEPEPMAGISITIPFGGEQRNCDKLIEMEEASVRIRKAQELYELGLISEDELKDVGRKAYAALIN